MRAVAGQGMRHDGRAVTGAGITIRAIRRDAIRPVGVIVGLLSGAPPLRRALRQLMIGYGAAGITWLLGLLVGGGIG